MGTSLVNITDRKYMLELQQRIIEFHYESTEKRMANRMHEEVEREKRLVLENKMPISEGPAMLMNHPVFVVKQTVEKTHGILRGIDPCRKKKPKKEENVEAVIRKQEDEERRMDMGTRGEDCKKIRALRKAYRQRREKQLERITGGEFSPEESFDNKSDFSLTREPLNKDPSMRVLIDLSEPYYSKDEDEQDTERSTQRRRHYQKDSPTSEGDDTDDLEWDEEDHELEEMVCDDEEEDVQELDMSPSLKEMKLREEEESKGYMLPENKFEKLKYESPLVKELKRAKTVDEMYSLADQIVGPVPDCQKK